MLDALQEILHTISKNKLRSGLTAFGVFWGIFMLILLLGSGQGIKNKLQEGWTTNAKDSVWIFANRTMVPYKGLSPGRQINLTKEDLEAIRTEIPGIRFASSENPFWGDTRVRYKNSSGNFGVYGVGRDFFKIKRYQDYRGGRMLNDLDDIESRKVTTIGTKVVERLFPPGVSPVGKQITINDISFTVVGYFYDEEDNGRNSERIYIPQGIFERVFGTGNRLRLITYEPEDGYDRFELEDRVLSFLRDRHLVSPEDKRAIRANNLWRFAAQTNDLFTGINAFIWFVGIGTMAAGIVGISNIMIITVKERSREIGVRKALGARPIHIVSGLLVESILLTSFAGYLGLVAGVGLLELITYLIEISGAELPYFERPEVDFTIAAYAIVTLVSVGAIAGFIPAWYAAKISPVEALRSE